MGECYSFSVICGCTQWLGNIVIACLKEKWYIQLEILDIKCSFTLNGDGVSLINLYEISYHILWVQLQKISGIAKCWIFLTFSWFFRTKKKNYLKIAPFEQKISKVIPFYYYYSLQNTEAQRETALWGKDVHRPKNYGNLEFSLLKSTILYLAWTMDATGPLGIKR